MAVAHLNPASSTTNISWDQTDVSYLDAGDTAHVWTTTTNNANLIVTLDDFDNTGVASIDSIQVVLVGNYAARSGSWTAATRITTSAGDYNENLTVPAGRTASIVTGTARTTSDGSAAWTDGNLDEMSARVFSSDCTDKGQLVQFYIRVTYTEAATGYTHTVNGVAAASIATVKGVATANIETVIGVD